MIKSGYIYLLIVYVVWGSTYLAMRIGIGPESGFPVFSFAAIRCLVAGSILIILARLGKKKIVPGRRELIPLVGTGIAMWLGAHGLVLWSEQYIDSGFAAIAVSLAPIWVMLINSIVEKILPDIKHVMFIIIGFIGVGVLMYPQLQQGKPGHLISIICLITSTLTWSCCSVYLKKNPIRLATFTISGYQHLFGGAGFFIISLVTKEPCPTPTTEAWIALLFLIIFGSLLAFTAYIKMLRLLPIELITTNTFINPVIAMILGWAILGEQITGYTVSSMTLVLISIVGIIINTQKPIFRA